jgi:hypothetical protein
VVDAAGVLLDDDLVTTQDFVADAESDVAAWLSVLCCDEQAVRGVVLLEAGEWNEADRVTVFGLQAFHVREGASRRHGREHNATSRTLQAFSSFAA